MIRLSVMALSVFCLTVVVCAGCYGPPSDMKIEIGEEGPLKPRFVANYDISNLDVYHVYGWPEDTSSSETPDGKPVRRYEWVWSVESIDGIQSKYNCKSIRYGELPYGYEEQFDMPLETGKLYRVEVCLFRGGPLHARKDWRWFCILEDQSGDVRLIVLTFRDLRNPYADQPFNEVKFEIEEGTRKILKIIPVASEKD